MTDIPDFPFQGERPPGAPDSLFYWALSNALLTNDAASHEPDFDMRAYAREQGCEIDTLLYVAQQRAMRTGLPPALQQFLVGTWLDGFMAATRLARQQGAGR